MAKRIRRGPDEAKLWALYEDNGGGLHIRTMKRQRVIWLTLPPDAGNDWQEADRAGLYDRPDWSELEVKGGEKIDAVQLEALRFVCLCDGWEIVELTDRPSVGATARKALRGLAHIGWLRRGGERDDDHSRSIREELLAAVDDLDLPRLLRGLAVAEDWGLETGRIQRPARDRS